MHLDMKHNCEKCGANLHLDSEAYLCSFECTFCPACAASFENVCPNCGGELVQRPKRINAAMGREGHADVSIRMRPAVIWASSFGIWAIISMAATMTVSQMYRLNNGTMPFRSIMGMEFSQILAYAPLTPFVFGFALRYPLLHNNWKRRFLLLLAGGLVFTLAHICITGATPYGYWDAAHRQFSSVFWNSQEHAFRSPWLPLKRMFFANLVDDVAETYVAIVIVAHALLYYRRFQEKEVRAAQLESQLVKARLQTLKTQLQPHFLFNTLHSISSLMLTDVIAADRMMSSLSDMLRMSLENNGTQLTTLQREVEFLNVYLEIEKARFERLTVGFEIAPECLDAQVPHLLLQPLVENAVRHGISKRSSPGEIQVVAKSDGNNLLLWVRDNGPGLADPLAEGAKRGLGLSVTRERLLTLYGNKQFCEIRNIRGGGAEVYLRIPLRVVPETSAIEVTTASDPQFSHERLT
jgi:signal transduction histidine kinase